MKDLSKTDLERFIPRIQCITVPYQWRPIDFFDG